MQNIPDENKDLDLLNNYYRGVSNDLTKEIDEKLKETTSCIITEKEIIQWKEKQLKIG